MLLNWSIYLIVIYECHAIKMHIPINKLEVEKPILILIYIYVSSWLTLVFSLLVNKDIFLPYFSNDQSYTFLIHWMKVHVINPVTKSVIKDQVFLWHLAQWYLQVAWEHGELSLHIDRITIKTNLFQKYWSLFNPFVINNQFLKFFCSYPDSNPLVTIPTACGNTVCRYERGPLNLS